MPTGGFPGKATFPVGGLQRRRKMGKEMPAVFPLSSLPASLPGLGTLRKPTFAPAGKTETGAPPSSTFRPAKLA